MEVRETTVSSCTTIGGSVVVVVSGVFVAGVGFVVVSRSNILGGVLVRWVSVIIAAILDGGVDTAWEREFVGGSVSVAGGFFAGLVLLVEMEGGGLGVDLEFFLASIF